MMNTLIDIVVEKNRLGHEVKEKLLEIQMLSKLLNKNLIIKSFHSFTLVYFKDNIKEHAALRSGIYNSEGNLLKLQNLIATDNE